MEKNINYNDLFLNNNSSGHKCRESWLLANYPDIHGLIIEFCKTNLSELPFKEKIWHFINNKPEQLKCECGKTLKFKNNLSSGYGKYCSIACTNKSTEHKDNVKKSNIIKYGNSIAMLNPEIQAKIIKDNIIKYGVNNIFENVDYIRNKTFEKHGVNHISKLQTTKDKISKTNKEKYGVSTPLILDKNRTKLGESLKFNFINNHQNLNIININKDNIEIKCHKCESTYIINRAVLFHRNKITDNPCIKCHPIKEGVSIYEAQIKDFIISLDIDIETNNRTILDGQELDIYIPKLKLAIEFNGIYWHSEKYVESTYHIQKTQRCEQQDIQLIHIFEDEWVNNQNIVKSRLENLVKQTKNKIYARKCVIRLVPSKDCKEFLNKNHIQGHVNSSIKLGLYYNNELVSLMTFGGYRKALGNTKQDNMYELLRFCNKLDTTTIGGANKLLQYFIKNYNPKKIISYADRRWSKGNLYETLGFEFKGNTTPNYWYIIDKQRKNRFNYRKDVLIKEGFDSNKTEHEIMIERNILRIYDSGNKKYELVLT